ncbi:MAG: hypothetical protein FWD15_00420 [Alphaproteobacteria bacterium]|nr:hypothetical protein [Alphaproteobacteria bacterium]
MPRTLSGFYLRYGFLRYWGQLATAMTALFCFKAGPEIFRPFFQKWFIAGCEERCNVAK